MSRNVSFAPDVDFDRESSTLSPTKDSATLIANSRDGNNNSNNSNDNSKSNFNKNASNSRFFCPNCGSSNIESQEASGASVCTDCGVVVEENAIVSAVEFVEGAGGASNMVGQFVSGSASKAYSTNVSNGGRGRWGFSRDSRETTLANGRRRIQEVASRLRLGTHFVDGAHRLFSIAVEKNFVQGRRTLHVVAACLYMACRQEKSQHMLIDFSDALQVNVYVLGSCFLKFRRLLGLPLELMDPALYIYRFAAHLQLNNDSENNNNNNNTTNTANANIGGTNNNNNNNRNRSKTDAAHAVSITALRLIARMKRDWMTTGRRPAGICAAALLLAARLHGYDRNSHDVTRILRVCGWTVQSRVREIEQTSTASMTLPQLLQTTTTTTTTNNDNNNNMNGDSDEEEAFLGGANDGADPPIYTRNKIQEARAKAIRAQNTELLHSGLLDDPYSGKMAAKWRQANITERQAKFDSLYNTLAQELESTSNEFDRAGINEDSNDDQLEQNNSNSGSNNSDALVPITEKVMQSVPAHLEHVYPKAPSGRALILPEDATPEELQDPIFPVEAQLSLTTWKESMPDKIKQEMDSLFRDEQEELTREAIFHQLHGDYQTPVPRVAKKQKKESKKTTEEQLREAVMNRKVSRKINYDALSFIFDASGDFDTSVANSNDAQETNYEDEMYQ